MQLAEKVPAASARQITGEPITGPSLSSMAFVVPRGAPIHQRELQSLALVVIDDVVPRGW